MFNFSHRLHDYLVVVFSVGTSAGKLFCMQSCGKLFGVILVSGIAIQRVPPWNG